jgi:hypothetical protein
MIHSDSENIIEEWPGTYPEALLHSVTRKDGSRNSFSSGLGPFFNI